MNLILLVIIFCTVVYWMVFGGMPKKPFQQSSSWHDWDEGAYGFPRRYSNTPIYSPDGRYVWTPQGWVRIGDGGCAFFVLGLVVGVFLLFIYLKYW